MEYTRLSPEGTGAMRAAEHYLNAFSGLDGSLLEMVRLRVSERNGCAFCIGLHRHELERRHEPVERIEAVAAWRETEALTAREKAALRWAEALTDIQDGHASDVEYAAVGEHFGGKELVDLSLAIAMINAWNRVSIAFRPQWDPAKAGGRAPAEAVVATGQDDDGKVTVEESEP